MNMEKELEKYKNCVEICSKTDYGDKQADMAVAKMYSILKKIKKENAEAIKYFFPLLDDEKTGEWFSHQLLELFEVEPNIEKKALKIIKKLAKNECGERYWLADYYKNKKKSSLRAKWWHFRAIFGKTNWRGIH